MRRWAKRRKGVAAVINPVLALRVSEVRARIADFQAPGGIIDLMYSAIFTRGQSSSAMSSNSSLIAAEV